MKDKDYQKLIEEYEKLHAERADMYPQHGKVVTEYPNDLDIFNKMLYCELPKKLSIQM